ncbi:MAG: adenylate/guanylate cyclase domain-containing protein [Betaproteobacteria bacterium]|nr:adenylate/guanylate cyclase domain-containing protein [Betaproteobacteria bacterium]
MSFASNVNRTVICSIVFVDIVGYSKQTVARQLAMKGWFNDLLSDALRHVAHADRIILDTGDGAAICFPGDPEDALFATNSLRVAVAEHDYPDFALRIGVNLGPVKMVTDINGQPNIIGDGINVAQRVMSFAAPNQILVSRSYYDVVACLSEEYSRLFRYGGVHQDKHVREHEVYEIDVSGGQGEARTDAPAPRRPAAQAPTPNATFEEPLLKELAARLAAQIGPIAPLIVNRAAKRAADLGALLAAAAEAIPEPERRRVFLAEETGKLGPSGAAAQTPAPVQAQQTPRRAPENAAPVDIDEAWVAQVETLLARHIGPIAKVMVRNARKAASSRAALVAELAGSIERDKDRAEFAAAVEKLMP